MNELVLGFINIFLLIFGLLLLTAGIFTIYFGAGKGRKLGAGILVSGLLLVAITYWLFVAGYTSTGNVSFLNYLIEPAVYIIAAVLGAISALIVFIGVITKA
jgi:hypothetical protein